ncbi:hypothetical protein EYF80_038136 [Liparis tanakae]|uniref:Uncharacterized protein n=1 Tax=Liparis tanakae TaxID=230148 RepID=A0A4Z2GDK3_9TELE|nr:hypothetical protein EYF80_038136 [Liparis tanakae]
MLGRSRNANVSSAAFVRNTVIRPPAPWVEPLAAAAPAPVCFDVNRKVSRVPEGSCQRWRTARLAAFRETETLLREPRRAQKRWVQPREQSSPAQCTKPTPPLE